MLSWFVPVLVVLAAGAEEGCPAEESLLFLFTAVASEGVDVESMMCTSLAKRRENRQERKE